MNSCSLDITGVEVAPGGLERGGVSVMTITLLSLEPPLCPFHSESRASAVIRGGGIWELANAAEEWGLVELMLLTSSSFPRPTFTTLTPLLLIEETLPLVTVALPTLTLPVAEEPTLTPPEV